MTNAKPTKATEGLPEGLPEAEQALAALLDKMRGAVAMDAKFIGIYSGGAWLAERLAALVPGEHPVGFIDVSFYRDDYGQKGLRASMPDLIGALAPVAELFALKGSAGDALTAAVSSRGFLNTKQQPGQGGGVDG